MSIETTQKVNQCPNLDIFDTGACGQKYKNDDKNDRKTKTEFGPNSCFINNTRE